MSLMLLCAVDAADQTQARKKIDIQDAKVEKQADSVCVSMSIDISSLKIKGASSLILTPIFKSPQDSLELPSVEIMGKKLHIYYLRNKISGTTEVYRRDGNSDQIIPYTTRFPYEPWMDNAMLYMSDSRRKCCVEIIEGDYIIINTKYQKDEKD